MTTHLVIADPETLDKIADNADNLATDYDSPNYDKWDIDTHDTWLFRTPEQMALIVPPIPGILCDVCYWQGPPVDGILPLIAACDLLGVDEL